MRVGVNLGPFFLFVCAWGCMCVCKERERQSAGF